MSNTPHKAADIVNVFAIVLIGIASALLLWASAVALQGYYLQSQGPVSAERQAMELESEKRSVWAQQIANLHRSEENATYANSAEPCFRNPIEAAMLRVVADAEDGTTSLVPAVGPHDQRSVAPVPGYPNPLGTAGRPVAPVIDPNAPVRVTVGETSIEISEQVQFDSGSATISAASTSLLDEIAAILINNTRIELVEIAGHTDNEGDVEANTVLSKQRAEAVKAYLVSRSIAAERLSAEGYGPTKPIADNATDEGREQNRRVELVIIKQASPE